MKIAYFTDTFLPQINGVTNTLGYLSAYLTSKDVEHIFIAPDYDEEPSEHPDYPVVRFRGIKPLIYPECRLVFPPHARIIDILIAFQPDVVHIVTELGIGYAGLRAARELQLPVIMSYHTNYDQYLDFYNLSYLSRPVWSYVRWFHQFAAITLCPSRATADALRCHGIRHTDIWSRGIDRGVFSPAHADKTLLAEFGLQDMTVFLYVGRIAKEKGLDTLAESIKTLSQAQLATMAFVFTGDGPYLEELKALGIPNAVFTGCLRGDALAKVYASCDVFVFPSGTETFGNVFLEAMASGLPGICVDAGGVTDFTEHGENAYVCRYRDAEDLAAALTAMTDETLRNHLRAGALKTAQARDWPVILDGLMRHYDHVLKESLYRCNVAV
ncbi:glycosyltransferase family 1 protein [Oscillospiraceae bacterium WX1]